MISQHYKKLTAITLLYNCYIPKRLCTPSGNLQIPMNFAERLSPLCCTNSCVKNP